VQLAEVGRQLSDDVVRQVEVLEQRQRDGQLGRQIAEVVVRGVEVEQAGQLGKVVEDRQLVERNVEAVQLAQLEQLARQFLQRPVTQMHRLEWRSVNPAAPPTSTGPKPPGQRTRKKWSAEQISLNEKVREDCCNVVYGRLKLMVVYLLVSTASAFTI